MWVPSQSTTRQKVTWVMSFIAKMKWKTDSNFGQTIHAIFLLGWTFGDNSPAEDSWKIPEPGSLLFPLPYPQTKALQWCDFLHIGKIGAQITYVIPLLSLYIFTLWNTFADQIRIWSSIVASKTTKTLLHLLQQLTGSEANQQAMPHFEQCSIWQGFRVTSKANNFICQWVFLENLFYVLQRLLQFSTTLNWVFLSCTVSSN